MNKFSLAGTLSEHGHLKAAASFGVSDEFITELARSNLFDLLDRSNSVLAVASAAAVLDLHEVGSVCVLDDCL